MANTLDLEYKTEQAVIDWLQNVSTHSQTIGIAAASMHHGDGTSDLALPAIFVLATDQGEYLHNSGHYKLTVAVTVRCQSDDTALATAKGYFDKVRQILGWDALAARLSDLAGFNCWLVIRDGGTAMDRDERHTDRVYTFTVIAQARDG
jgi:hypothetical protein